MWEIMEHVHIEDYQEGNTMRDVYASKRWMINSGRAKRFHR